VYRRCYADGRACYQTDYATHDAPDSSDAHCLRQGNFTRPIILTLQDDLNIRDFIRTDPLSMLTAGPPAWLAAEARPLPISNNTAVQWEWLHEDTPTGTSQPIRVCTAEGLGFNPSQLLYIMIHPGSSLVLDSGGCQEPSQFLFS